jgi:F-type H+-transporting ATPase subunit a
VSLWRLLEIRITPDVLFYIGPLPVTNTLLCTWLVIISLIVFFYFGTRRRDMVPRGMQNLTEWIVEQIQGLVYGVSGKDKGKKFFPLVATFFIFILACNLIDILPGVDTIGSIDYTKAHELHATSSPFLGIFLFGDFSNAFVPWFRPPTSDLNLNFAMSITAVLTAWAFGFASLGPREFFGKYLNFGTLIRSVRKFDALGIFQGFIEVFVGLLELLDEVTRILSLAFRLFGNIFAGGAVLAVFAFILPFAAAIAFIPLELFVGFVQALVFSLLTLVYLEIATTSHGDHEETVHEAEAEERRDARGEPERQEVKEAATAL